MTEPGTRTDHCWVMWKDGDRRRYASAEPFAPEFAASMLAQGYAIRRVDYEVPDSATECFRGRISP